MGICIGIGNYIGRKTTFLTNKDPSNIYYNLITEQGSNILTEMKNLILRDLNNIASEDSLIIISEDNKVIIKDEFTYPGLIAAWSAKGKTNDDADRAVLRDLTGNGHDITLNNFAFSGMSGYGGYGIDFSRWSAYSGGTVRRESKNKIVITSTSGNISNAIYYADNYISFKKAKINVNGADGKDLYIIERDNTNIIPEYKRWDIKTDGEYILESDKNIGLAIRSGYVRESCNIVIEILPEYPDALVLDGVDDYGICENMPILTDYTVIVKRKCVNGYGPIISKSKSIDIGAFIVEVELKTKTYSYGSRTIVKYNNGISFQTSDSYNGQTISKGDAIDTNEICIGTVRKNDLRFWEGAFYSAYLFDRSLDEQEIKAFIRKYIDVTYELPSEQTT